MPDSPMEIAEELSANMIAGMQEKAKKFNLSFTEYMLFMIFLMMMQQQAMLGETT